MNQFTSKQDTSMHQSSLLAPSSNESQSQLCTFKSIFMQKHSVFTQSHLSTADKGEQLPKLFEEVFSCDNSNNMHGHGILKTKSHSDDLKISVQVLCKESSCFFLKIQRKSDKKQIKLPSSCIETKTYPQKKVSFNEFEKDPFSSHQLSKQERDKALEVYRRQSRSLDDIQEIQTTDEKDKQDEKVVILDSDLWNSLNSQSVSSKTSKSESVSFSSVKQPVFPKLGSNAIDKNKQSIETPCFNSSRQNQFDFQGASNESNKMAKIDTNTNENYSKKQMPSLAELKIQIDGSHFSSLQSSESLESENIHEIHPETRDKLIIKQQLLAARSCTNESVRRSNSNLMVHRELNSEILLSSAMLNHTYVPVMTSEELKFNPVLESKSPKFDKSLLTLHSDEALKDCLSPLRGNKDSVHLNYHQFSSQDAVKNEIRKQQALSSKNLKASRGNSNFFFPGYQRSNSIKLLSSQNFSSLQRKSASPYSTLSGRVCRTSIISEKASSHASNKPPDNDQQSMQSKQSKNSLQNAEAKIKASQLFVYKIIHDLRHPTDSISQGLTDLVKELPMEKFVRDPNLRLNNDNIYQYKAHDRVTKALQICNDEVSVQQSQSSRLQISFSRSSSLSLSKESNAKETKTQGLMRRFVSHDVSRQESNLVAVRESNKDEQPQLIDTMQEGQRRRFSEVINSSQSSITEKLRNFYVDYNSIDIMKVELPRKVFEPREEQKQLNHQEPHGFVNYPPFVGPVEEEKEPLQIRPQADNNDGRQIYFGGNDNESLENEEELQIDDNISEGSSKISCLHSGIVPQKIQFQRDQVSDLVQKGIQNPSHRSFERKPFSLAADRLIFKSEVMVQIRNNQPIGLQKLKGRSKSCLTDVLDVMDSFKEESEEKFQSSKAMRLSGQIKSLPIKEKPEQSLLSPSDQNLSLVAQQKFESSPHLRIHQSVSSSERNNSPVLQSFLANREKRSMSNRYQSENAGQDSKIGSKVRRSIKILQSERKYLVAMVNDLLTKTITTRNRIETMEGQTGMMMMLLRDLMNQAQLGNNTFTMVNEYFNVCSLVKRCIQLLKAQANLKNVQLSGPILEKPSDSCYFHLLYSDERRYSQFILNFLSNSIKFTPSGGQVTVLLQVNQVSELSESNKSGKSNEDDKSGQSQNSPISAQSAPDKEILPDPDDDDNSKSSKSAKNRSIEEDKKMLHFEMIFRDTGVGISPENQNRLFQNFGKVSETQEVNKLGVGLGLSICKEIINAHGGSVDIESEMGKGTDFIINLKSKCIVDHNWQLTMQEDTQKNQLRIDDSNISPFMILEESEHSSAQDSAYDPNCNDSDKEISDDTVTRQSQSIMRGSPLERKRSNSNRALTNSQDLGNNNKKLAINPMKRPLKSAQNLSTIDEGSLDDCNESSIGYRQTRCLLANDDLFLLSAFEATLKAHFDLIDKVENGQAAVDAVKAQPINYYSVIVLDIQMPIMNGMEACVEILAHFQQEQEINLAQVVPLRKASLSLLQNQSLAGGIKIHPSVYALTSEAEPEQIQTIMKAGFRQIYNVIDQNMIRQILENANLVYRERIAQSNSDKSDRFDADKLSNSSQSKSDEGNHPGDIRPAEDSQQQIIVKADSEWIQLEKKSSIVSDDQDQAPYQQ